MPASLLDGAGLVGRRRTQARFADGIGTSEPGTQDQSVQDHRSTRRDQSGQQRIAASRIPSRATAFRVLGFDGRCCRTLAVKDSR